VQSGEAVTQEPHAALDFPALDQNLALYGESDRVEWF
jgi:hypothetical protein